MTKIFDSHIHTEFSHDSTAALSDICKAAKDKHVDGITVTDHCDIYRVNDASDLYDIQKSAESTAGNFSVKVFSGMELGDGFTNTSLAIQAAKLCDFDLILCSCHMFATMHTITDEFKKGDFNFFKAAKSGIVREFLSKYYDNLIFSAENLDYDVLAHITFPFRYINGISERHDFSAENCIEKIDALLEIAVSKQKAIEINTSGVETPWGEFMPEKTILERYKKIGGRLITIGSDAHKPERTACGIPQAVNMLKSIGFNEYFYYKKRKPQPVEI